MTFDPPGPSHPPRLFVHKGRQAPPEPETPESAEPVRRSPGPPSRPELEAFRRLEPAALAAFFDRYFDWIFGVLYLWYSWYMDKRGGDNVAHDAHFFGALYGIVFMTVLRPSLLLHLGSFQSEIGL